MGKIKVETYDRLNEARFTRGVEKALGGKYADTRITAPGCFTITTDDTAFTVEEALEQLIEFDVVVPTDHDVTIEEDE